MNSVTIRDKQYKIEENIGTGGYSSVFRVSDTDNKLYALKKICFRNVQPELIEGFRTEKALIEKLKGETRVIDLIDWEEKDNVLYLVLELGDVDLSQIIGRNRKLELHVVRHYSREIFKCVEAIHKRGIVHSDLKPQNFLCVRGVLKLIDFGLSDSPQENTLNVYRTYAVGTLSYMAPEMFREHSISTKPNKHSFSASSDVWGCGCIMFEMIYGKKPFDDRTDKVDAITNPEIEIICSQRGPYFEVPWSFRDLIGQCLTRDPAKRVSAVGALQSLALTELRASVADIRGVIDRAIDFGFNNKEANESDILELFQQEMKRYI